MLRNRSLLKVVITLVMAATSLVGVNSANAVPAVRVIPLDAGGNSTCALRAGNDVYCVGENTYSQLGGGLGFDKSEPVPAGVSAAQSVSVGTKSVCAIGSNQKGYCWGDNSKGQLGNPAIGNGVRQIALETKLIDISVGDTYVCAVTVDEKLYCWGEFVNQSVTLSSPTPVLMTGVSGVKSVSVGKAAVCVTTNALNCFGPLVGSNTFVQVDRSTAATAVSVGNDFACFIVGQSVRCLGDNSQGQLGNGSSSVTAGVIDVTGINDAVAITTGAQHACSLNATGSVFCWGDNSASQITTGTTDQLTRVPVSLGTAVAITAGNLFSCALLVDSSVRCLGDNSHGQNALVTNSVKPLSSVATQGLAKVSAGNSSTCVIDLSGLLRCFGEIQPELDKSSRFTDVAVGNVSSCAITTSGSISCWGSNSSGQLGDNTNKTAIIPTTVLGLGSRKAVSISAGFRHFCAVMDDGLVMCWGDNSKDQLGFSGLDSKTATPVAGIGNAISVASGDYHSCALLITKKVMCWGDNSKKQISTDAAVKIAPNTLNMAKDVKKVAAAGYNSCFLFTDNSAECIGDNTESQAPGAIAGNFRDISVGGKTVCLLRTILDGGLITCLGSNASNKLGRTGLKSSTLVDLSFSADVISVGYDHVCSIGSPLSNLLCWGDNTSGQLASSFGFPSAFNDPNLCLAGTPNVGETLSAVPNNSEPTATAEYSWYKATDLAGTFSKVSGASTNKIVLSASDQGKFFKSFVIMTKWGTNSQVFKSAATTAVGKQTRILITPIPVVSGKAKVGQLLIARAGNWEAGTKLTYQWYRGGWVIGGENKPYYRVAAMDVGKQLSVAVTGTKTGYSKVMMKSVKTSKVTR